MHCHELDLKEVVCPLFWTVLLLFFGFYLFKADRKIFLLMCVFGALGYPILAGVGEVI